MMMTVRCLLASCMVAATLHVPAAAQPQQPDTSGSAEALWKSRAATKELLSTLRRTLENHLAAGDTPHAVDICADTAQALSESIASKHALEIRRISDRWRNPLDEPDPFENSVLLQFAAAMRDTALTDATEAVHIVAENGKRVFRYLKPIRLQEMCTACHGDPARMSPAVVEIIKARYPDDRATGYAPGDLRGAVSVRLPLVDPGNR